jgi:hypothetical protein
VQFTNSAINTTGRHHAKAFVDRISFHSVM